MRLGPSGSQLLFELCHKSGLAEHQIILSLSFQSLKLTRWDQMVLPVPTRASLMGHLAVITNRNLPQTTRDRSRICLISSAGQFQRGKSETTDMSSHIDEFVRRYGQLKPKERTEHRNHLIDRIMGNR